MTSFELPVEPPPHTLALSDLDRGQARPRLGWTETASGAIVNRYKASIPSAACGIAAIAMAAITFGLLVVMPATIAPGSGEIRALSASPTVAMSPADAVRGGARKYAAQVHAGVDCVRPSVSGLSGSACPGRLRSGQSSRTAGPGTGCPDVS